MVPRCSFSLQSLITVVPLFATVTIFLTSDAALASGQDARSKRADDVTPLQRTLTLQADQIEVLKAEVEALKAETAALKTRQQALSTPVAFYTRFKVDPAAGIPLGAHATLKFDNVITNLGQAYDPVTGIFTAPVPGVYAFFLSAMSVNQHTALDLVLTKHGTVLDEVFAEGGSDNYDQGSTQVVVHLLAGEEVWVRQQAGDAVRGGAWTVFNGYLLQAD